MKKVRSSKITQAFPVLADLLAYAEVTPAKHAALEVIDASVSARWRTTYADFTCRFISQGINSDVLKTWYAGCSDVPQDVLTWSSGSFSLADGHWIAVLDSDHSKRITVYTGRFSPFYTSQPSAGGVVYQPQLT